MSSWRSRSATTSPWQTRGGMVAFIARHDGLLSCRHRAPRHTTRGCMLSCHGGHAHDAHPKRISVGVASKDHFHDDHVITILGIVSLTVDMTLIAAWIYQQGQGDADVAAFV